MSEFNVHKIVQHGEQVAIHAQNEQRKELKFLGSLKRQKGQTVFEINYKDKTIQPAKFAEVSQTLKGKTVFKLIANPDCSYVAALNKENAVRKFNQKLATID